jgi:hypothetical protein
MKSVRSLYTLHTQLKVSSKSSWNIGDLTSFPVAVSLFQNEGRARFLRKDTVMDRILPYIYVCVSTANGEASRAFIWV